MCIIDLYYFSRRIPGACGVRRPSVSRGYCNVHKAIVCLLVAAPAFAEKPAAPDCEPRPVHFDAGGQPLTRAEKIELMDKAFYDSLGRFEACQTDSDADGSDADSGVAETGQAETGDNAGASEAGELMGGELISVDEVDAAGGAAVNSVEARGIRGTGPVAPESDTVDTDAAASATTASSGKLPEDIPDVDNDDAIAKQIRLAATAETDPVLKARLWNEYRRYKGLPTKPVAGDEASADEVAAE